MFRHFINFNIYLSKIFEKLFLFNKNDKLLLSSVFQKEIKTKFKIADVGGGKKPTKMITSINLPKEIIYDGYDIDLEELEIAREAYNNIYQLDLNKPQYNNKIYDLIICLNTLEHVEDVTTAISNLELMTKKGGKIYVKLPCKYALFTRLNLIIPNKLKNRIMHKIFPSKKTDGFPAFYDKSTPNEIINIFKNLDLEIESINLVKWSSYFSFFFPLYIIWRFITIFQNIFIKDYCESFELIFNKKK
tara:strand:+ start:163 stop:900 length:738 start_codon:yes stop_codon:yes gene_type:complete